MYADLRVIVHQSLRAVKQDLQPYASVYLHTAVFLIFYRWLFHYYFLIWYGPAARGSFYDLPTRTPLRYYLPDTNVRAVINLPLYNANYRSISLCLFVGASKVMPRSPCALHTADSCPQGDPYVLDTNKSRYAPLHTPDFNFVLYL